MIATIFNSFFDLSIAKFVQDISELEYEKQLYIEASQNATLRSDSHSNRNLVVAKLNATNPIAKWFAKECKRSLIRAIIRNEVRFKLVCKLYNLLLYHIHSGFGAKCY